MARYAKFLTGFWRDPEIAGLSAEARLLYIWTFANESCRVSGLYPLDLRSAFYETRLEKRGAATWKELLAYRKSDGLPLIEYDPKTGVAWVRGRFKIESRCRPSRRPSIKIVVAAIRECLELPHNPLIPLFREKYQVVLKGFAWGMDRVSAVAKPRSSTSTSPSTIPKPKPRMRSSRDLVEDSPKRHDRGPGTESRSRSTSGSKKSGRGGKKEGSEIDASDVGRAEGQHRKVELYTHVFDELGRTNGAEILKAIEGCRVLGVYRDTRRPIFEATREHRDRLKVGLLQHFGPSYAAKVVVRIKDGE